MPLSNSVKRLFSSASFVLLANSVNATTTGLWIQGSPTSFVGLGQSFEVTPADGFSVTSDLQFNNSIVFRVYGVDSIYGKTAPSPSQPPSPLTPPTTYWWEIAIGVGNGALPQVGTYIDPNTSPDFVEPYLSVTGNFRATNQTSGEFRILELQYGIDGMPSALAVDFLEFEENDPNKSIVGSLRYNSSFAMTAPEPSALALLIFGFPAVLLYVRATRTRRRNDA